MSKINNALSHLLENYTDYYWSIPLDINFPAVRLGDIYAENILFIFEDYNHYTKIKRVITRKDGTQDTLTDLEYSAGIIKPAIIVALINDVKEWINNNQYIDTQNESMLRTKNYINDNFDF
ncbi:hypothetical protein GCM10007424_01270 [Flavobacterium suaedae]|uniref:Uncharacterized protein n=1 Tax=Flavobacterium suaedae TaxID=1767027 RepID=A0ABQ1JC19_9FLAO|nr:hypothetical protein [Flavobacterium suaedae]GGB65107.1 hypothetical protein GCM10007424_01270 [Flavobacterium suaedae]